MSNQKSWVNIPDNSDFTIYNFPFGIASYQGETYVVSRLGDSIILLSELNEIGVFDGLGLDSNTLISGSLNAYMQQGKEVTVPVRERMIDFFGLEPKGDESKYLVSEDKVNMLLPVEIKDYTDFYSSREHATNVGTMFRDPANALMPNWLHLPVGYHGRASSIVVSGTDIVRPKGQQKPSVDEGPVFGPCKLLDFELELGFVINKKTELGSSVSVENAEDYIFGIALFNDWSARDIQKWEYVPLGPFLGKNFASTLSPWIVTLEALEPFRVTSPKQDPEVLDYLKYEGQKNFDIALFVDIVTENGDVNTVCKSNFQYMYWNMSQQLAHHTVNGCNINSGDLYASGTISGKDSGSYGSMLELSWKGTKTLPMKDGTERKFLKDGDTVNVRGKCTNGEISLGFGECSGEIFPAR